MLVFVEINPPHTRLVHLQDIWSSFYHISRHNTGSTLVQVMAWCLFCAKPLLEPTFTYCQLGTQEQSSVKFESRYKTFRFAKYRKWYWPCCARAVWTSRTSTSRARKRRAVKSLFVAILSRNSSYPKERCFLKARQSSLRTKTTKMRCR